MATQGEPEHGNAVDGAAGPVGPGPEVAPQRVWQRQGRPEEAAEAAGRGSRGRRRHEPHDDAAHVEQQHDVEGRSVRLVMHGRHVLL